jgi:hypothetical protein
MAKKAKKTETAEQSEETVIAPVGLEMEGLGDFTVDSLRKTVQTGEAIEKGTATGADVREAMGNVRPMLEVVKIKGHGANLYQRADGKQIPGEVGITGVVVAFTRHNSYWDSKFGSTEAGELPPCFSNDGLLIAGNAETPQSEKGCASCPRNRDAKQRDAREAAFEAMKNQKEDSPQTCTNYISLAVMVPGEDLPVRIRFTNRSFKPWAAYCQKIGTVEGRLFPHEALTTIKLKNNEGANGEYSTAVFEFEGALTKVMRENFALQRAGYTALLQRAAEAEERDEASDEARSAQASAKAAAKEAEGSDQDAGL